MPTFFPNPGHNNSRIKQLNRKQSILHLIVHRLTLASVFCLFFFRYCYLLCVVIKKKKMGGGGGDGGGIFYL